LIDNVLECETASFKLIRKALNCIARKKSRRNARKKLPKFLRSISAVQKLSRPSNGDKLLDILPFKLTPRVHPKIN